MRLPLTLLRHAVIRGRGGGRKISETVAKKTPGEKARIAQKGRMTKATRKQAREAEKAAKRAAEMAAIKEAEKARRGRGKVDVSPDAQQPEDDAGKKQQQEEPAETTEADSGRATTEEGGHQEGNSLSRMSASDIWEGAVLPTLAGGAALVQKIGEKWISSSKAMFPASAF